MLFPSTIKRPESLSFNFEDVTEQLYSVSSALIIDRKQEINDMLHKFRLSNKDSYLIDNDAFESVANDWFRMQLDSDFGVSAIWIRTGLQIRFD